MKTMLILLLLTAGPASLRAAQKPLEPDALQTAVQLLQGGNHRRALQKLQESPPEQQKTFRWKKTRGLALLYNEQYKAALQVFDELDALDTGDRYIAIHRGQSLFGLKNYQGAMDAFEQVADLSDSIPALFAVRGECLWQLGKKQPAFDLMDRGRRLYPEEFRIFQKQFTWLLESGLYQTATDQARLALEENRASTTDLVGLAGALRRKGYLQGAIALLEIMHLREPENIRVLVQLSFAWMKQKKPRTSAMLMEKASLLDPRFTADAAELYRRAGYPARALRLNSRTPDQKKKFRLRLALLINLKRYDEALATRRDLARLGLLNDEDIRYALAWASFAAGDHSESLALLRGIVSPELFPKVVALRKQIEG